MERTSKHCMKARISICHNQINTINKRIKNTSQELASRLPNNTFQSLTKFLKSRAESIRNTINARHNNKHENMKKGHPFTTIDKNNWVINLSQKPLTDAERSLLQKGPKLAPSPSTIPYKNIVAEVEAAIIHLPDESKDAIRTTILPLFWIELKSHRTETSVSKKERLSIV